ncbi:stearoyl-CoA 9-desaturase [Aspergillus wentii]|nr:stearoyl-CoA 9-desaturase [Aspergillus wentii]
MPWTPLYRQTLLWSVFYYLATVSSITGGYHRLWAHRAYTGSTLLRLIFAAFGAGAIEGSIKFWAREHRAHHRYTDTDRDPYNVQKSIAHAHILWIILKQPKKNNRVDISDLKNDPIVVWQHNNYLFAGPFMAWIFPSLVAGIFWGDWYGGFVYTGIVRTFLGQQATFCINSLGHYLGEQPFDDRLSPRDSFITAIVTLGEGYHNFHHEFPSDYRNGVDWHQPDWTKWLIWAFAQLGLAQNLKRFRQSVIDKGRLQQDSKKIEQRRAQLDWGPSIDRLPVMEWMEFQEEVRKGKALVAVEGVIHNVDGFIEDHPGGEAIIRSVIGKDATSAFNGGVYDHSNAARNMIATMRVAALRGGGEVEIWK